MEGIIAKTSSAPYREGRSDLWQKIKCSLQQEFVIGGFTKPKGSRTHFGALLIGLYEGDQLRYVGRVGTGFNQEILKDLLERLSALKTQKSPFQLSSPKETSSIHWVEPRLIAQVKFQTWTRDKKVRQASYQGLREDKSPREVSREMPRRQKTSVSAPREPQSQDKSSFRITHPDRIVYPASETKKIDVAQYYKSALPWMLPHLAKRPLSFLRCPDEVGSGCFFQKHANNAKLTEIGERLIRNQKVFFLDSEEAVLQLVQWGVIEFHLWQCREENPERPEQLVFDLDPGEGVSWSKVKQTALRLRDLLEQLSLQSFLKTTGGKGLHIHVPIAPIYSWEAAKEFAKSVSKQLEINHPKEYTTTLLKKKRQGKIFLDYLRNGFGATAVAPYSLRAKEQPFVALPMAWSELKTLRGPQTFDISSTLKRLAKSPKDPWHQYWNSSQKIRILDEASRLTPPSPGQKTYSEKLLDEKQI